VYRYKSENETDTMSNAVHNDDFDPSAVAAKQSEELFRLYQTQLKFKDRELVDTRNDMKHLDSKFNIERDELKRKSDEKCAILERQIRDLQDTLRLREAELATTQNTLNLRSDTLEQTRNELVKTKERARIAEQECYDAKIKYKEKSEKLAREHKEHAIAFHEQLTLAFEKRLQKLKLKHTQDLFLAKKIASK
jgi:hypothetical protein